MQILKRVFFILSILLILSIFLAQGKMICNKNCEPDCTDKECGDDGCGGLCGDCEDNEFCNSGVCYREECPNISEPQKVSLEPLEPNLPAGRSERVYNNGFIDYYLYDDKDYLKIGIRENWGSSIIFYGLHNGKSGTNSSNTIDSNDTGREVQVALYDPERIMQGCAWNASCLTNPESACPVSIRYLGWNPVQGGNRCNNGSGTESIIAQNGILESEVIPLFWNPDWDKPTCDGDGCNDLNKKNRKSDVFYRQRLRFIRSHIVEMQMRVENLTDISHLPTLQEFPTLYASFGQNGTQDLRVLLDSNGNVIPIDVPANDGFFMKDFESNGGWVTLQNQNLNYGIGIYYENKITSFQGWQKYGVFNNVRARFNFGIPPRGNVNARAYLMIGSFNTIASLANQIDLTLPPFGRIDSPKPNEILSQNMQISGWALDNKGVTSIKLLIDGIEFDTLELNIERQDVCQSYPGYINCPQVGFSKNISISNLSTCPHIVEIEATDTDGNKRIIDRVKVLFY